MNEAEKEQALKLSALFKELAEKGTWFEVSDVVDVCHWRGLSIQEFYKCYKERGLLPEFILYVVIWPISMSVLLTAHVFVIIAILFK